jgi:hypothetical protein
MVSITDGFLTCWLRKCRYKWSRLRRKLCEAKYRDKELPAAGSLEDIKACLKKVTWSMDGPLHLFDSISYPQTVWAKKKDDCDGFAILAATLLQRWQPECRPVLITAILRPASHSHTVCGFYAPDGALWFFDNYLLRKRNFHTYAEIVTEVKGKNKLICWDVVEPSTLQPMEFHRE